MAHFFTPTNRNPSPPDYTYIFDNLFNPPTQKSPQDEFSTSFNKFNKTVDWAVTASIVTSILGSVVLVVIIFAIINCLRRIMIPVTDQYILNKGAVLQATSQPYALVPNSDIEMGTMERFLDDVVREKPIRFSPQELLEITKNKSTKLGSGSYGVVYKGELPNGTQVAVKVLKETLDKRVEEQFMAEVGTMGRTHHINLIRLYGFCFDESMKALVYEYMENGSLDGCLFDKNSRIDRAKLHEIAIGIAKGIAYLHEECQQKIIHYDIKPGNILLDAEFNPKVADFGMAKLLNRDNTRMSLSGMRGTPGYAAPELFRSLPVTSKCDVYSFGILLFEILGRRRSLVFNLTESQEWLPRWVWEKYEKRELKDMMSVCEVEEQDRETAERMTMVALWCVQYQPEARPQMSTVVKMLEGGVEIAAPTNPFQHLMTSGVGLAGWSESNEDSASGATDETKSKGDSASGATEDSSSGKKVGTKRKKDSASGVIAEIRSKEDSAGGATYETKSKENSASGAIKDSSSGATVEIKRKKDSASGAILRRSHSSLP